MVKNTQEKSISASGPKNRLDPSFFNLPVHEIRCGYRSAVYFWRSKRILEQENHHAHITHQIFQKKNKVMICGTDEVIAILKCATGYFTDYDKALTLFNRLLEVKRAINKSLNNSEHDIYLKLISEQKDLSLKLDRLWVNRFDAIAVHALYDGDTLSAWETAMLIEGDYSLFAHLESLYLGILARRTKFATNSQAAVKAAQGKPVLYFADRFDHFAMQDGDGYAAHIGGVSGVATNAMASWYGEKGLGTIPHAMIVSYGGDSYLPAEKFNQYYPEVHTISLVDFDNDCVNTSLKIARRLGDKLWGVRLDTTENLVDLSLQEEVALKKSEKIGVAPLLVEKVRKALDREGFQHVKIIVSGGFYPGRIARFEALGAPVDIYAVGSWILSGRFDFTADAVRLNGKNLAKVGREYKPNKRLTRVTF
ncbi:MAG: nicotinate phosphoribosyltransferase, partial [bacterium]